MQKHGCHSLSRTPDSFTDRQQTDSCDSVEVAVLLHRLRPQCIRGLSSRRCSADHGASWGHSGRPYPCQFKRQCRGKQLRGSISDASIQSAGASARLDRPLKGRLQSPRKRPRPIPGPVVVRRLRHREIPPQRHVQRLLFRDERGGRRAPLERRVVGRQRLLLDRRRRVGVAAEPAEHRRDDGVLPAAADRRAGGAGRGAVGGLHPAVAVDCLGGHRQRQRRRVLLRRRRGRAGGPPEPPQVHPRVHVRLRRPAGHRRGHQLPSDRPGAPGRGRGRTREALAAPAACLHPKWRVLFS